MKRDGIEYTVTSRAKKMQHEHGMESPATEEHAHNIDTNNGNNFWRKAIEKKMRTVGVAFEILDKKNKVPYGRSKVTG